MFMLIVLGKKLRTKAGLLVVAICVADGFILREPPFDLDEPNAWVIAGFVLILAGLGFRLAAYGCLKKKEVLATTGVYSLCRHPLYLGSILLTYGFCCLLDDVWNWVAATAYFLVFYTLTIIWEEIRLAERYGAAHEEYARATPILLPLGRFHSGEFLWSRAMHEGGGLLICISIAMLAAIEVMAETMNDH
jgi:protein-S-isoprenylcysteine O-methyltransferase Ste14